MLANTISDAMLMLKIFVISPHFIYIINYFNGDDCKWEFYSSKSWCSRINTV